MEYGGQLDRPGGKLGLQTEVHSPFARQFHAGQIAGSHQGDGQRVSPCLARDAERLQQIEVTGDARGIAPFGGPASGEIALIYHPRRIA